MAPNKLERIHRATNNFVHYLVLFVAVLTFAAIFLITLTPAQKTSAVGLPFGGRLIASTPPVVTGIVNCPSIATVANIGGVMKGTLFLMLPPSQPRAFYQFYRPGVAVLGSFIPTPLPFNCPVGPIFPAVYFGTSAF